MVGTISTDRYTRFSFCSTASCKQRTDDVSEQKGTVSQNDSNQQNNESASKSLTFDEKQQTQELKKRDTEVRAHEAAHVASGGQYVRGGAQFQFETGPDGKQYAVGGEVSIDTSEISGDPEATIRKMQTVRKAALAPASPSSQDRSVAAAASQKEMQARQELNQRQNGSEESQDTTQKSEIDTEHNNAPQEKKSPYKKYLDRYKSEFSIHIDLKA